METVYFMDPQVSAILGSFDACVGLLVGLLLLVVGLVTVRSAHPTAGYLVGAGGGLQLLSFCCGSWQTPAMVWMELYELTESVGTLSGVAALLFHLASAGLLIAGAAVLARALSAARGAAGGA